MVSLNSFYGVQLLVFQALLIHIFTQQHKRKSAAAGLLGIKYTHWGTYKSHKFMHNPSRKPQKATTGPV